MTCPGGNLWKMCYDEDLTSLRHLPEGLSDLSADLPAYSLIDLDLVEHQCRQPIVVGENDLETEHESRELSSASDLRERSSFNPAIELNHERDGVRASAADLQVGPNLSGERSLRHAEPRQQALEPRQQALNRQGELFRRHSPLLRERLRSEAELLLGLCSAFRKLREVRVRRIEHLEFAASTLTGIQDLFQRRPVFLQQSEEAVAPRLH